MNSWMCELEIRELERNFAENYSCKGEERSVDDTGRRSEKYFDRIGSR